MKKAFTNIILTLTIVLNSQVVPQAFNYQGIARDASGNSLSAKQLGVRITLQEKNGNTTTDVYSETHSVTTNIFGLFNIPIGRGISSLGNFSTVNFTNKNITVRTEIDPNGGNNYTLNGNSELLSVPYALVAGNVGNSTNYWNKNIVNNFLYVNTNEKIGIGTDAPNATLDLVGTAKFGTLPINSTNTKLLTADASGNLAFRDLSSIIGTFNGGMMEVITGAENPKTVIVNAGLHVNDGRARLGYTNTYSDVNATDILFNAWKNQDYKPQRLTSGYIAGITYGQCSNSIGDYGGGISIFSSPVGPAGEVVNTTNSLMYLKNNGNIGLSTQEPKSKLHISQGDVYIDDATKGIIMKSPNGQCWRVTINNTGGFTSTSITCP